MNYLCHGCTSASGCDDCPWNQPYWRIRKSVEPDCERGYVTVYDEERWTEIFGKQRVTPSYVIAYDPPAPRKQIWLPEPRQWVRYCAHDIGQCLRPQLRVPLDGWKSIWRDTQGLRELIYDEPAALLIPPMMLMMILILIRMLVALF